MNGRVEIENKIQKKIERKINDLPQIFGKFYNYLESDRKSYATCERYIDYVCDFMKYVTRGKYIEDFYKNVAVSDVRAYISSLRSINTISAIVYGCEIPEKYQSEVLVTLLNSEN